MLGRVWIEESPPTLCWECKLVLPLRKTVWRWLEKLKIEDLIIPFLSIYPDKIITQKDTHTQCSQQLYLQYPRHGDNLNISWQTMQRCVCVCVCIVQFSSVDQPCLTLCDPMDCSMPGFPVHHQLPELTQTHVHCVSDAIQSFSSHLQSFPASGSFQMSQFFTSGGQSIGVSALASVLPMNIQDWFPLGWTGCTSLQLKGLSRVFSNTTVQKHQLFGTQLSL